MQRPSPGNRYSAEELESDRERIAACLEAVKTIASKMKEAGSADIRVAKDAAYGRCLEAAKAWARSVEDGFDEVVHGPAARSQKPSPQHKTRSTR